MSDSVTITAAGWNPCSVYNVGDVLVISGCANATFGGSWPRWINWILGRVSPKLHDFLEMALFNLSECAVTMFDFHFGPKRVRITSVHGQEIKVVDRG